MTKFSKRKREHFLDLVGEGQPLVDACAAADVSRQTVSVWLARGRHRPGSDAGAFAAAFDAIRSDQEERREQAAAEELPEGHPLLYTTLDDPLLALNASRLAFLNEEEVEQVHELHPDDPVVADAIRWAGWLRENVLPPYDVDRRNLPEGFGPS